jgi:hypothetical protein
MKKRQPYSVLQRRGIARRKECPVHYNVSKQAQVKQLMMNRYFTLHLDAPPHVLKPPDACHRTVVKPAGS